MTHLKAAVTVGPLLVGLLAAGALTGCGNDSTRPAANSSSQPGTASSSTSSDNSSGSTSADTGSGGATGASATPSGAASSSGSTPSTAGDSADAVTAAKTIFTTWDRPELDYATWWGDLEPLLSPAGQQAYARTDPSSIPKLRVTGPYKLDPKAPDDPTTTALVHVPTDRGSFGLFLVHSDASAPWRLLRIVFPKGIH